MERLINANISWGSTHHPESFPAALSVSRGQCSTAVLTKSQPTVWRCLRTRCHDATSQTRRGYSVTRCRLSFPSPGRFAVCCFHQVHPWPVRSDSWWGWQWRGPSPWLRLCGAAFCRTFMPWILEDNMNEFIKADGSDFSILKWLISHFDKKKYILLRCLFFRWQINIYKRKKVSRPTDEHLPSL